MPVIEVFASYTASVKGGDIKLALEQFGQYWVLIRPESGPQFMFGLTQESLDALGRLIEPHRTKELPQCP